MSCPPRDSTHRLRWGPDDCQRSSAVRDRDKIVSDLLGSPRARRGESPCQTEDVPERRGLTRLVTHSLDEDPEVHGACLLDHSTRGPCPTTRCTRNTGAAPILTRGRGAVKEGPPRGRSGTWTRTVVAGAASRRGGRARPEPAVQTRRAGRR